ncbi:hypothetical protein AcW1_003355 [Taiwanofungus camphoratus]|nr:hypothetical protein AcV5_002188 [Antrodia cinnamomea]KAI0941476.1 hypothetical protein AcW1_003355 [Antrodia cinnamomea]KAI0944026.1 hypothetical protein AcV7_001960 [Antrodia cinnamomea]
MLSLSLVAASTVFLCARAAIPSNLVPVSTSGSITSLKYTNVGGPGTYNQVIDLIPGDFPACTVNPSCVTQPKTVSGALAPFDDEMTMVFRGPMNIYNIAVYQPGGNSNSTWSLASSWASGQEPSNMVFMNNMGGDLSGNWSICGGASQSYANGSWTGSAATPNAQVISGYLQETDEINIMTDSPCDSSNPCDGFSRGTANHAWAGSKMFVVTFDMPPSSSPSNVPAIWMLNGQVVRSAQYGCNCRGTGATGCAELDVLEVLTGGNPNQAISEIYSFKGATGTGANYFPRPTSGKATYGVIFDLQTDSIVIQQYTEWDYTQQSVARPMVDGYLSASAMTVSFTSNSRRSERPRSFMGAHRRHNNH